jgi:hypothetical protein
MNVDATEKDAFTWKKPENRMDSVDRVRLNCAAQGWVECVSTRCAKSAALGAGGRMAFR